MSIRFLYDTGVFLYATGAEHAYRAPCREIVRLAAEGALLGKRASSWSRNTSAYAPAVRETMATRCAEVDT